jgi:hypothetical protein
MNYFFKLSHQFKKLVHFDELDRLGGAPKGFPFGAFLKAGPSANDRPLIVGTKSINNSPKHTTCGGSLIPGAPSPFKDAFVRTNIEK